MRRLIEGISGRALRTLPPVLVAYLPYALLCTAISIVSHLSEPPIPEALVFRFSDKLMHAAAYSVVGGLALLGAARRRLSLSRAALVEAVLLATVHGAFDEVHQAFVPKRFASVGDLVADLLGATLGALLMRAILRRVVERRAPAT